MNRLVLAMLWAGLLGTGCATLEGRRAESLTVHSVPAGAQIRLDGVPVATTPATVAIDRVRPQEVEVVAAGFHPGQCPVRMSPGGGYLAGDIVLCVLLFPIGCISFIDASGAWNVLDRPTCTVSLAPAGAVPGPPLPALPPLPAPGAAPSPPPVVLPP